MDIGLHGLDFSLLSTMISDLNQTAAFTQRDGLEANPFVKPIVENRSPLGEMALGGAGLLTLKAMDQIRNDRIRDMLKLMWLGGHVAAVKHNEDRGWGRANIIFPVLQVTW